MQAVRTAASVPPGLQLTAMLLHSHALSAFFFFFFGGVTLPSHLPNVIRSFLWLTTLKEWHQNFGQLVSTG